MVTNDKIESVLEVVEVNKVETDKGFAWRMTLAPEVPGVPPEAGPLPPVPGPAPPEAFREPVVPAEPVRDDALASASLDDLAPHDVIGAPVRTLYQDIGLYLRDDDKRRVFVEYRNDVDKVERQE